MAGWDTFGDMKNRVRDGIADYTDAFNSVEEIGNAVNEGVFMLHQIMRSLKKGNFFNSTPEEVTISSSGNFVTLTNDIAEIDEIIPKNDADKYIIFERRDRHSEEFRGYLHVRSDEVFGDPVYILFDIVRDKTLIYAPRPASDKVVNVYRIDPPTEMTLDGDTPQPRKEYRPIVVEYAVRKLKAKEESGEHLSNEKLMEFLLENMAKAESQKINTNLDTVDDFDIQ